MSCFYPLINKTILDSVIISIAGLIVLHGIPWTNTGDGSSNITDGVYQSVSNVVMTDVMLQGVVLDVEDIVVRCTSYGPV